MEGNHKFGEPTRELTLREREVLMLVRDGYLSKEVALKLGVMERTVKNHLTNIFNKLGVGTRTGAVVAAIRLGYITLEGRGHVKGTL